MAFRKRNRTLSVQQRLEVLEDLGTLKVSAIARKYNVCESTIRSIRKNAPQILKFKEQDKKQKRRQRIRNPVYEELEQQLLTWFIRKRNVGDFVSDKLLLKKASQLKDSMPSCSTFKVSVGWLAKFKNRNNIRLVHVHEDCVNADEEAAKRFVEAFKILIKEEEISEDNIYHMDETGLYWKGLPNKTSAERKEKSVKGWKSRKERVTLALCTNATGNHKLMPLLINKFKHPRALKNQFDKLPIVFKAQSNAWMTQSLFVDWYENYFIPSVESYHARNNKRGKVILLLNNCSSHKLSESMANRENFKIMFFPPNSTSLIQPMDQGIIAKIKMLYRYKLMRTAATYSGGINQFFKNYNLKDCIDSLLDIWGQVSVEDIRNAWKKVIPREGNVLYYEMQHAMKIITGDNECSESDVMHFMSDYDNAENEGNHEGERLKEEKEDDEEEEEEEERGRGEEGMETFKEHEINELKYLLNRLDNYVSRRGPLAQDIFQAMKNDLLGLQRYCFIKTE